MPRFRSTRSQAEYAVSLKVALGKRRHGQQNDGRIHSVGTTRGYEQVLKGFAEYLQSHRLGDLRSATLEVAQQYLADRASAVAQKTLDLDRQAIQMHLGIRLEVVKSERETSPPGAIPLPRSNGSPPPRLRAIVSPLRSLMMPD